jgi:hypothetical protein
LDTYERDPLLPHACSREGTSLLPKKVEFFIGLSFATRRQYASLPQDRHHSLSQTSVIQEVHSLLSMIFAHHKKLTELEKRIK